MGKTPKDPFVGTRIREYQILEIIGKGGMGAVYKARHIYLDEDRAIKIIDGRIAGQTNFVERFIREAKTLRKLHHPNLVQLHEFGTLEEDTFFMVLEFIQGESVLQRINRLGRIAVPEAISIVRQAALGLESAHEKGIIHRDISPDNLILFYQPDGKEITKVIDFGIAKPLFEPSSQPFTVTNLYIGKPEYSSPEQCGFLEEGEMIDARADVYSLGVTLYFMLAGTLPFHARTPQGYMVKHVSEIPKPVSSHFSDPQKFPSLLDRVILKALSKRREQRQSSMEEFIRELDNVVSSELITSSELSPEKYPASPMMPGYVLAGRYLIEKILGTGGMGVVYKAIDKILEVPVALKVMNREFAQNQPAVERFKREVILARKVAHPNACHIYDIGESEGIHYVSMEYLEGKTLYEMLRRQGTISPDTGIPILKQILSALQEAHRVGIVHRDLKPQNIIVDQDMRAHIMDFGISISSDATRVTKAGAIVGTPQYMAPEQFEGKDTDLRADIYSIGVIMYEMFTGKLPFDANTPVSIIFAHLKLEPPKPSKIISGFPQTLEQIILKALQKERSARQQNVRELLQELEPLSGSTTGLPAADAKQIANRLLAEQSYSKAIKLLSSLVKNHPENPDWKTLLHYATTEKNNKEMRRIRHLIQKRNLIQAQLLIEKLARQSLENPRIVSHVRKLGSRLEEEKEQAVQEYLSTAENSFHSGKLNDAATALESAWNLKPNDPRLLQMQEKLQTAQKKELEHDFPSQVERAKFLQTTGKKEEAVALLDDLLKENPSYEPARILRNQVIEGSKESVIQAGALGKSVTGTFSEAKASPQLTAEPENAPVAAGALSPKKSKVLLTSVGRYWWAFALTVLALTAVSIWWPRPVPPLPVGFVSINALPWAQISITSVNKETKLPQLPKVEMVTPCYLTLPEGEYSIKLENRLLNNSLVSSIHVEAGKQLSYVYTIPGYNPESILVEIGEEK